MPFLKKRVKLLKKGDVFTQEITDLSHIGQGVTHVEQFPVFVEQALIGEKVTIQMDHVGQHRAFAHVLKWHTVSPDRAEGTDQVYTESGTMPLQHMKYSAQLRFKQQQVQKLFRTVAKLPKVKVEPTLGMEYPYKYRNKAQIPVREVDGQLSTGFYRRGTHDLLPIEDFIIQAPEIDTAIIKVRDILRAYHIQPYDELNHQGTVRHLVIRRGHFTGQMMIVIVTNGFVLPHAQEIVQKIRQELPEVVSIIQNINRERTNVILGKQAMVLYGQDYYEDQLLGHTFQISHRSFYQVNSLQTEKLYQTALDFAEVKATDQVIDAYCGIGTMTLAFAEQAAQVDGVEIVPEAIHDAKNNAQINQIKNAHFEVAAAEKWLVTQKNQGMTADLIVVDPPRKGLDKKFVQAAIETAPERFVYVSCNPATLARDVKRLIDSGIYQVGKVQPVDMFPQTNHVETVALLSKLNTEHHLDLEIGEDELSEIDFSKDATYEKFKSLY